MLSSKFKSAGKGIFHKLTRTARTVNRVAISIYFGEILYTFKQHRSALAYEFLEHQGLIFPGSFSDDSFDAGISQSFYAKSVKRVPFLGTSVKRVSFCDRSVKNKVSFLTQRSVKRLAIFSCPRSVFMKCKSLLADDKT